MQVYSSFNSRNSSPYYKKRKSNKIYFLFGLIILVAGFIFWSILREPTPTEPVDLTDDAPEPELNLQAQVAYVKGQLKFFKDNDWVAISENDKLDEGAQIKTEADSRAVIKLPDGSLVRLSATTEIKLEKMTASDMIVQQLAGSVFNRINGQSSAIYSLKNNQIELTALGTGFDSTVKDKTLKLTVTESRVKVKIFDQQVAGNILNTRTIEEGNVAVIDPTKTGEAIIKSEKKEASDLLGDAWLAWNKDEDEKGDFYLGVFGDNIPLVITSPEETESETTDAKLIIKGTTSEKAEVFINGAEITNTNGTFEKEIELASGENKIEISVQEDSKKNKKVLLVNSKQEITGAIDLTAEVTDSAVKLTWKLTDIQATEGFRLVKAKTEKPTFPENDYHKLSSATLQDSWTNLDGGVYHFRVCLLENQTCKLYSNDAIATIEAAPTVGTDAQITLTGKNTDQDISLTWEIKNIENIDGFKVLIGTAVNPSYPANSSHDLLTTARSDNWKGLKPNTYHFRVCAFAADKCLIYSNDALVTVIEEITSTEPAQIILSGQLNGTSANLSWTTKNLASPKGYYIVMAETPNPTFPGNKFMLASSATDLNAVWTELEAGKTYYFRLCENVGGACGLFSNQVTLIMP
jgi:hypothetical protein